jgi:ketosteroid isomerase-like protein
MSAEMEDARALVARYYAAFNAGDVDGMLACLSDDVAHHVNEGAVRKGKPPSRRSART